jgi:PTS system nitrogen regulatory IIA component
MSGETMDLEEVAQFLQRDMREVTRLASRGYLPGRKVGGEWKFSRTEISHWVENQLHAYTEVELANLEGKSTAAVEDDLIIGKLLPEACIAVPLQARTRASVLAELLKLAEQSWQIYDSEALLNALIQREELASTAQENGIALPHPHRPLPNAVGDTIVAYGRTSSGIPFGAPHGVLTDIFFLVAAPDGRAHLRTLARIARLLLRPDLLDNLRAADSAHTTFELLAATERELLGV